MSALNRDELIMACAKLYDASQENYMLPPLTRGAADESETSFTYQCLSKDICLKFSVVFDDDYVQRHKFPLAKLPLKFKAQICDRELKDLPIKVDEKEKSALIYAFLLGVRAPIALEEEEGQSGFTLSIQLSPTFFVRWRESFDIDANATADDICRKVGLSLYEKSKDFFLSEADGVAVWSVRAAQELLGVPKPSGEGLWSCVAPPSLFSRPAEGPAGPRALPPSAHRPAAVTRAAERLPLAAPAGAPPPSRTGRERQARYILIATLLLAGTIGSLNGAAALRAAFKAPPPMAKDEAPATLSPQDAPAAAASEAAAQEASVEPEPVMAPLEEAPVEEPAPAAAETVVPAVGVAALTTPPPTGDVAALTEPAMSLPVKPPKTKCKTPKQAGLAKVSGAETPMKTAAPGPRQAKSAHRNSKRPDNPLVIMGQAIHRFATHVAKGLQSIPHRFSAL